MAEQDSPGLVHQRQAEQKTSAQAAANQRQTEQNQSRGEQDQDQSAAPEFARRIGTDQTPERASESPDRDPVDAAADPFPNYAAQNTGDLESLAESRGVVINPDPLRAQLIKQLRENDGEAVNRGETQKDVEGASRPYASYDVMPLQELISLAESRDVKLDEGWKKAHLITELRAADTTGGVSVQLAADGVRVTR